MAGKEIQSLRQLSTFPSYPGFLFKNFRYKRFSWFETYENRSVNNWPSFLMRTTITWILIFNNNLNNQPLIIHRNGNNRIWPHGHLFLLYKFRIKAVKKINCFTYDISARSLEPQHYAFIPKERVLPRRLSMMGKETYSISMIKVSKHGCSPAYHKIGP